jgi:hypothetical protein
MIYLTIFYKIEIPQLTFSEEIPIINIFRAIILPYEVNILLLISFWKLTSLKNRFPRVPTGLERVKKDELIIRQKIMVGLNPFKIS